MVRETLDFSPIIKTGPEECNSGLGPDFFIEGDRGAYVGFGEPFPARVEIRDWDSTLAGRIEDTKSDELVPILWI